jgi:hypothetical protein
VHYKGTENVVADALSRRPDYELRTKEASPAILTTDSEGHIVYNHQVLAATNTLQDNEWLERIREATTHNEVIQKILGNNTALTKDGLVLIHDLVYVPGKLQEEIIKTHHDKLT